MQATTVSAQGEAKSDYNLATFSLTLDAERPAANTAKILLKKKVDELMAALDVMKQKLNLEFVKNSVQSSSNVNEINEWSGGKNVFLGYRATYSYSFQIDNLDQVSAVYDVLTSLEEVSVSSPHYSLKNRDKLNKKALKQAFEKVTERFETECKVLGLNPTDFEIASWEATYSDSHRSDRVSNHTRRVGMARATAAMSDDTLESAAAPIGAVAVAAGAPTHEPLELVIGQASVTVNLEVGYAKRATQTIKAKVVKESPLSEETTHV